MEFVQSTGGIIEGAGAGAVVAELAVTGKDKELFQDLGEDFGG